MNSIGRALGFYIKYWDDMNALLEDPDERERCLKGIPDLEKTDEMIQAVGEQAHEDAYRLLSDLRDHAFNCLPSNCKASRYSQGPTIRTQWFVEFRIEKAGEERTGLNRVAGFAIKNVSGVVKLVTFLWVLGGLEKEIELGDILAHHVVKGASSTEYQIGLGSVVLGSVDLLPAMSEELDIDKDWLVDKALEPFRRFTVKDFEKVFNLAEAS